MIYVFKTTVQTRKEVNRLEPMINALASVSSWNFDLQDCDNILRVVGNEIAPKQVISLLQSMRFGCKELE